MRRYLVFESLDKEDEAKKLARYQSSKRGWAHVVDGSTGNILWDSSNA